MELGSSTGGGTVQPGGVIRVVAGGVALVVCAPSGTGKTTLTKRLLEHFCFSFSVSCTTRSPRAGEVDGKDYHFLSRDEFLRRKDAGFFAEWAEVYGNFYGTPLKATQDVLQKGENLLFDIDVQGATQLRKTLPEACFVFIIPPSKTELERRLRDRGTETEETLYKRLSTATTELAEAHLFDFIVVNDDLERAWTELKLVVQAAPFRPACRKPLLDFLQADFKV